MKIQLQQTQVLVWEEDGEESSTLISATEMTVLVDGVETLTWSKLLSSAQ